MTAPMQRLALGIEYDGQCFHGWQTQGPAPHAIGDRPVGAVVPTVQDALETALSQIAAVPIQVMCAGRTDAGVHATGQVVHFDTPVERPDTAWVRGVNAHLPDSCAVRGNFVLFEIDTGGAERRHDGRFRKVDRDRR